MNILRFSRVQPTIPLALALALFAVPACRQQAFATPTGTTPAAPATAAPLPAYVPGPPVPATFDVAALSERVKPLVVNITTTHAVRMRTGVDGMDPFEFFFGPRGFGGPRRQEPPQERVHKQTALGTGFIIDPAGYVATNAHVVDDADEVRVRLMDDREFKAEVVGRDPKLDLALLKLQGATDLPAATLGSSEQLRVGEHVLAVGNPFGLGHTVTLGIVSAKARTIGAGPYDDFIQTDASINPGNSGGPLFNWKGEVVGINTAIKAGANGIGFAIPVDTLREVLPQLRDKGHVERGKLGVSIQPMTPELAKALGLDAPQGALVAEVEPGGAAARAGIQAGDVIVSVNGVSIHDMSELPRNVAKNPPGANVKLGIIREKQKRDISATLDLLQEEAQPAERGEKRGAEPGEKAERLGIRVSDARGGGVRVDDVLEDGTGRELQPGDVIVSVNNVQVKNVNDLKAQMAKLKPGSVALLTVNRNNVKHFAAVPIPQR